MALGFVGSRSEVSDSLRTLGESLCQYGGGDWLTRRCDCKYGATRRGEASGCPEIRVAHGLIDVMTDMEYWLLVERRRRRPHRGSEPAAGVRLMAGLFVPNLTAEQIANARKWIAALRSGEYEQGFGQLRDGNKFCCLGVGCDVLGLGWDEDVSPSSTFLPVVARDALGLVSGYGWRGEHEPGLTNLNDVERDTFLEIADVIEEELALVTEGTA